jgi:hypothetical protein
MAINSTYAGEIVIDMLLLAGPRGSFDMKDIIMQASVFESIFQKGTFASFKVLDIDDAIGDMLLSGEEGILFSFHHIPPEGEELALAEYIFSINKVTIMQGAGGLQKAKTYTIECVSPETLSARSGMVQKGWENTAVSSMVSDIFASELGSARGLVTDPTQGLQKFNASNIKPFSAIDQLKGRANPGAYVFFENRDSWHFQTIENLYSQGEIKFLKQTDTIGSGHNDDLDKHIIHFSVVSMVNTEARIKMGGVATQVSSFDQRTRDYASKVIKPSSFFNEGSFGDIYNKIGRSVNFPLNTRNPMSFMPSENPGKSSAAADFMQLIVQMQVFGDTVFQAGKTVNVNIPKTVSTTGVVPTDPIVNGKFLISKMRHNIESSVTRPRYTCVIEGIRGNFDSSLGG